MGASWKSWAELELRLGRTRPRSYLALLRVHPVGHLLENRKLEYRAAMGALRCSGIVGFLAAVASLITLPSCGCEREAENAPAPNPNPLLPSATVGSESRAPLAIEPAVWPSDVGSQPRCGIAMPRDGSVLSPSTWRKTDIEVVTPGWQGRGQHDLIRVALDDFPAVTLSRDDTKASLGELSRGPEDLKEGLHTVFAYPVGKNGRHPKGAKVGVTRFWIGAPTRKLPPLQHARFVRLSSPTGSWTASSSEPALLDVVLFGTNLSDDRLKLRLSLRGPDGETSLLASEWTPLSLSGLGPGQYQVEAQLVSAQGHSGMAHLVELKVN